ncbi:MAG: ribbon-helix-helix domain-containing protein [Candidatus Bipolaricaulis sp.]|nr:ribbon-helix-helix domain-containing protein [Candidatus Bipolaricaulis sp.]
MRTAKVAVSLEKKTLERLDRLVADRVFASRSGAIQEAVAEKLERLERGRLAQECAKLDRRAEQALADEGLVEEPES